MKKSFIELTVGSLDEKRAWRQMMRRVNSLPEDYRFTYRQILHYFYQFGGEMETLTDLVELFEERAAAGIPVLNVVGSDVAAFCDELLRASGTDSPDPRAKLNGEILEYFQREDEHGKSY